MIPSGIPARPENEIEEEIKVLKDNKNAKKIGKDTTIEFPTLANEERQKYTQIIKNQDGEIKLLCQRMDLMREEIRKAIF